jgi:hypothetical protein
MRHSLGSHRKPVLDLQSFDLSESDVLINPDKGARNRVVVARAALDLGAGKIGQSVRYVSGPVFLFRQVLEVDQIIDRSAQGIEIKGLDKEVADREAAEFVRIDLVGMGGDQNGFPPVPEFPQLGDEFDAAHVGQLQVGDHEVDLGVFETIKGLLGVFGQIDPVFLVENQEKRLSNGFIIIDNDDLFS